jgi:dTDP-4-amino-4,6-dideoxygalactose transaminase
MNTNLTLPTVDSNAEHVFHLYVVQVENREKIIDKLNKLDVFPGIHYQSPVHLQPAYRSLESSRKTSLRVTESIQSTILSLPMYPELTETDINRVCEGVLNV